MPDRIGPFTFIRLSDPPQRVQAQWEIAARAGVPGVALWDTEERGEPFELESLAVALTYAGARALFLSYLSLVPLGGQQLFYGTLEPQQLYKVLMVTQIECKAVPRVHVANDPLSYGALLRARWRLLPLDPLVQPPVFNNLG